MKRSSLRSIPSVDKTLLALGDSGLPRPTVIAVVRRELEALRKGGPIPDMGGVLARVRAALHTLGTARIQPVINGTGILVHTNFGRAPLGPAVIERMVKIGSHYNNLEYGLTDGARSGRAAYLEHNLALLCGAEAATVVNNNAAALVLILRHFCSVDATRGDQTSRSEFHRTSTRKNEVVVSRGELIQIGGGFRIPEILESSGAHLREVGTTNKTSLTDYARAIHKDTALILKVHRSNFFMGGFVESPRTEEIAGLARKNHVPFVEDLGGGAVIETEEIAGLEHEPTPFEVLGRGVDLLCFSGDKLLGGPQSGIIAGKAKLVAALKREPLFRALRCDKLILSALEATVDLYLRAPSDSPRKPASNERPRQSTMPSLAGIPLLEMLRVPNDQLRARAEQIIAKLGDLPLRASVGAGRAQVGGGTLPRSGISSVTLELSHDALGPQDLAARLRNQALPVIGYVKNGKFRLDLRTIFAWQDPELVGAIRAAVETRVDLSGLD
jgi:L-seryl-tRNA(Ser) seleniumtransferase